MNLREDNEKRMRLVAYLKQGGYEFSMATLIAISDFEDEEQVKNLNEETETKPPPCDCLRDECCRMLTGCRFKL